MAAPAPAGRYLLQERYPEPGRGAPALANLTANATKGAKAAADKVADAVPKKSSAGSYSSGTLPLLAAAAAVAVFAL